MIRFLEDGYSVLLSLSLAGVSQDYHLSMKELTDTLASEHGLRNVSEARLRRILSDREVVRFEPDPRDVRPWKEQFVAYVANGLRRDKRISREGLESLRTETASVRERLLDAAGCRSDVLSHSLYSIYCSGVSTLTMDDDFISICRGDQVIEKVSLEGNDENDLKLFLMQGGDVVLSPENVEDFILSVRAMKKRAALDFMEDIMSAHHERQMSLSLKRNGD